jgi:tetratricopeptide (TPR) repeat protein
MSHLPHAATWVLLGACSAPAGTQPAPPSDYSSAPSAPATAKPGGAAYDALIEAGSRHVQAGEIDEALEVFEDAFALASERIEARYGLGVVSARRCWEAGRECDECVRRLTDVIERGGFRHSYFNRGECLFVQGKHEEALADFDAARARTPDDASVLEARGSLLLLLERRGGDPIPKS